MTSACCDTMKCTVGVQRCAGGCVCVLHLCWEMSLDHARDWALQGGSGHSGDRVGAAVAWASVTEQVCPLQG